MKNKLTDLNNHLFAQLERLSDEDPAADEIEKEVGRARAIVGVSDQIIGTAALQFKAAEFVAEYGPSVLGMIPETMSVRLVEHINKLPATPGEVAADTRRIVREWQEEREEWERQNTGTISA